MAIDRCPITHHPGRPAVSTHNTSAADRPGFCSIPTRLIPRVVHQARHPDAAFATVTLTGDTVMIGGERSSSHIECTNGAIHVNDTVSLPPSAK